MLKGLLQVWKMLFYIILDCRKRKIEVDFVFHKKVCKNFTNTLDNLSLKEVEGLR